MPGRRPKPTALKELQGTAAPGTAAAEPRADGALELPRGAASPDVRRTFNRLADWLEQMGVAAAQDAAALELLAVQLTIARQAAQAIERDGLLTTDERGMMRRHPALIALNQATGTARLMLIEFGLTPASRAKVEALGGDDEDPTLFEELFRIIGANEQ